MSLLMIVPSRGRPSSMSSLLTLCASTAARSDTTILCCVDADDPELPRYRRIPGISLRVGTPQRIGPTINEAAAERVDFYTHIGFMGDDHRPRTQGWDEALCTEGVAYGNDLIHGEMLPTAFVMSSLIIKDLGYVVPPGIWHLFFDNSAKDIGERYGLTYRSDVIMEHMHPLVGKAETDAGYEFNNSGETQTHDRRVYEAWREEFVRDRRPVV